MPLEIRTISESEENAFDESILFNADGMLTLEAQTMAQFLSNVDWSALMEDEDVKPFIKSSIVDAIDEGDDKELKVLGEEDEFAEDANVCEATIDEVAGEVLAAAVDEDDLFGLFEHFVRNELPNETTEDKVVLALFKDMLEDAPADGEQVEEGKRTPFKKGGFKGGAFKGASVKAKGAGKKAYGQRVRMMMAMLHKGAIKRVGKGKGYRGGDYQYASPKGKGSPAGKKMYKIVRRKNAISGKTFKDAKTVDPVRKSVVRMIYQNLGGKMPAKWIPPEVRIRNAAHKHGLGNMPKVQAGMVKKAVMKAGKSAGAKVALAKLKAGKGGSAKGKSIGDSAEQQPGEQQKPVTESQQQPGDDLNESVTNVQHQTGLAAQALKHLRR